MLLLFTVLRLLCLIFAQGYEGKLVDSQLHFVLELYNDTNGNEWKNPLEYNDIPLICSNPYYSKVFKCEMISQNLSTLH